MNIRRKAALNKIIRNIDFALETSKKMGFEGICENNKGFIGKINILGQNLEKMRNFVDFRKKLQSLYRIKAFSDEKKLRIQQKLTKVMAIIALRIQLRKSDFIHQLKKPAEYSRLFDLLCNYQAKTSRNNSISAFQNLKKPFLREKGIKKLINVAKKIKGRDFNDFLRKITNKMMLKTPNKTPVKFPTRCMKTDDLPKKDLGLAVSLEAFKDSMAMSPISLDRTMEKIAKSPLLVKPISKIQFSEKFRSQDPCILEENPQNFPRKQLLPQTIFKDSPMAFDKTNDESQNLNRSTPFFLYFSLYI